MNSRNSQLRIINWFLSLALVFTTMLAGTTKARADVDALLKAWTSVGSAGTVDEADTGKLVMQGSTIAFPELILQPLETAQPTFQAFPFPMETVSAVVRYNVVATDGLFEGGNILGMRARLRDDGNNAQVVLRLFEVNIETGATSLILTLDSNAFAPSANYQLQSVSTFVGNRINFLANAYFVEATLIQKKSPIAAFGGRPGLAIVQLNLFTPFN